MKNVALFGTSAIVKSGNPEMAKLLKEKGISVLENDTIAVRISPSCTKDTLMTVIWENPQILHQQSSKI